VKIRGRMFAVVVVVSPWPSQVESPTPLRFIYLCFGLIRLCFDLG
jgi:hypothetical protein